MKALVRRIDDLMQKKLDIVEFCQDPNCVFRVSLDVAHARFELPDTVIQQGDPIVSLHFWNEQLPSGREYGHNLRWAQQLRRQVFYSHRLLADELDRNPAWRDVRGFLIRTALLPDQPGAFSERKWSRIGYVAFPHQNPNGPIVEFWENFWAWMLWHTYQAGTFEVPSLFNIKRRDVWISADEMRRRYKDLDVRFPEQHG